MLKTILLDKAYVLGDAMALIETIADMRDRPLGKLYVSPDKMVKPYYSTEKISQQ